MSGISPGFTHFGLDQSQTDLEAEGPEMLLLVIHCFLDLGICEDLFVQGT